MRVFRLFFLFLVSSLLIQAREEKPAWISEAMAIDAGVVGPGGKGAQVVLSESLRVEYLPQGRLRTVERTVVKLLDDSGLDNAMTAIYYNMDTCHVTKAQAWVVGADGVVKQFGRKEFSESVAQFNQYYWTSRRALFFMRAGMVKAGGVLAWEYERDDPVSIIDATWAFRGQRRILRSRFEVIPLPGTSLTWHASDGIIPQPTPLGDTGALRWEMQNIAPLPLERPRGFVPNPMRVWARCVMPGNPATQLDSWSAFADFSAHIIEPRQSADAAVAKQAAELVAGKTERWERVRAISEYVQKQILYLALSADKDALTGYRPRFPSEVLSSHLGDCKDKANLMATMLGSLGERAYLVLVYSGNPLAVRSDWPGPFFNHAIVGIVADEATPAYWPVVDAGVLGRLVLFDPTDPGTPLGVLPEGDQGGKGLVAAKGCEGLLTLPLEKPEDARLVRKVTARIQKGITARIEVSEVTTGSSGARDHYGRYRMEPGKFREALERRVSQSLPATRNLVWKDSWDVASSRSSLEYTFEVDNLMRRAGSDMLLVSPSLFPHETRLLEWKAGLEGSVWLGARSVEEELRLELPEGYGVESKPADWKQSLLGGSCELSYRIEGTTLVYTCRLIQKAGYLGQAEYHQMRAFWQKAGEATRRQLILKRKPL